jgi:hypothetical protein
MIARRLCFLMLYLAALVHPLSATGDSNVGNGRFSITWGTGWEVTDSPSKSSSPAGRLVVRAVRTLDDGVRGVVFLTSSPHDISREDFEVLAEADIIEIVEKKLREFTEELKKATQTPQSEFIGLSTLKKRKVNGSLAVQTDGVLIDDGHRVTQMFVLVLAPKYFHLFHFVAAEENRPRLMPEFEEVLRQIVLR